MPPKKNTAQDQDPRQPPISSFFGQRPQRPLPFTSPDPNREGGVVIPGTPSQMQPQSPGVIVPGTPPTPSSAPLSLSMSPVSFPAAYEDLQSAYNQQEGLGAQFPPRLPGHPLSPSSGTAQELATQRFAAQQFAAQLAYQQQQQQQQQDSVALETFRQRAQKAQLANPDVLTQYDPEHFKGGRMRNKSKKLTKKTAKKTNKRNNRRIRRSKNQIRSKKSYSY